MKGYTCKGEWVKTNDIAWRLGNPSYSIFSGPKRGPNVLEQRWERNVVMEDGSKYVENKWVRVPVSNYIGYNDR